MDNRDAMDADEGKTTPEEARFLDFPHLKHGTQRDGKLVLNLYSQKLTRGHDFPGAQVWVFSIAGCLGFMRKMVGVEWALR